MSVDARQVVRSLVDLGRLTPEAAFSGLKLVGISRRNRVWIVRTGNGPSFVVKVASGTAGRERIAREAAIYEHMSRVEPAHRSFFPRLAYHEDQQGLLILEYVAGTSLAEIATSRVRYQTAPAGALGTELAHLHRAGVEKIDPSLLGADPPWILRIHRPDLDWYTHSSETSLRMRMIVQQHPELGRALDELREEWTATSLIHTDLKLDHVIARHRARSRQSGISIIDWESAQRGDPAWDIGAIFADYVLRWLRSIPMVAGARTDEMAGLATVPLQQCQQSVVAFWRAYVSSSCFDSTTYRQLLIRSTRSAAAMLILREEEHLQFASAPTDRTRMILQVSLNMLSNPLDSASVLLGLDTQLSDAP